MGGGSLASLGALVMFDSLMNFGALLRSGLARPGRCSLHLSLALAIRCPRWVWLAHHLRCSSAWRGSLVASVLSGVRLARTRRCRSRAHWLAPVVRTSPRLLTRSCRPVHSFPRAHSRTTVPLISSVRSGCSVRSTGRARFPSSVLSRFRLAPFSRCPHGKGLAHYPRCSRDGRRLAPLVRIVLLDVARSSVSVRSWARARSDSSARSPSVCSLPKSGSLIRFGSLVHSGSLSATGSLSWHGALTGLLARSLSTVHSPMPTRSRSTVHSYQRARSIPSVRSCDEARSGSTVRSG